MDFVTLLIAYTADIWQPICDWLWKNRPLVANIEFTLREFKVQ